MALMMICVLEKISEFAAWVGNIYIGGITGHVGMPCAKRVA